jgi:hypothetical protein
MNVSEAVQNADAVLPGEQATEGEKDTRWQSIIAIADFVEDEPEAVWAFVERWGVHPDEDLRAAIATCLLEHLLEYHFNLIFPRMERLAHLSPHFAFTVEMCSLFGESKLPENAARLRALQETCRKDHKSFS